MKTAIISLLILLFLIEQQAFLQKSIVNKVSKSKLDNSNPSTENANLKKSLASNFLTLLAPIAISSVYTSKKANSAEYYLIEPTKEFKDEVELTQAYRKQQAKIKTDWDNVIEKLKGAEKPEDIESNIKSLTAILKSLGDIPSGVKRTDVVKLCRSKKFLGQGKKLKPNWTTDVEISYQALIQLFNRLLNPDNAGSVLRL